MRREGGGEMGQIQFIGSYIVKVHPFFSPFNVDITRLKEEVVLIRSLPRRLAGGRGGGESSEIKRV